MSHLDRTLFSKSSLLELAQSGIYLEFDLFGTEVSHYQLNEKVDMPSVSKYYILNFTFYC